MLGKNYFVHEGYVCYREFYLANDLNPVQRNIYVRNSGFPHAGSDTVRNYPFSIQYNIAFTLKKSIVWCGQQEQPQHYLAPAQRKCYHYKHSYHGMQHSKTCRFECGTWTLVFMQKKTTIRQLSHVLYNSHWYCKFFKLSIDIPLWLTFDYWQMKCLNYHHQTFKAV